MTRTKALILAAGLGTRLRPLTDTMPKCLVPLAGRPLLEFWIDLLGDAAVREMMINTHTFPEQVKQHVAKINRRGCCKVHDSYEPTLLGSAGTIAANADFADDADLIVVIYADNLSDADLGDMIRFHQSHDDPFTMLLFHAPNPSACGIAQLDDQKRIVAFEEKPEQPSSDLANGGIYVLDAAAYREIAAMNAFDLGFDVLPKFIGRMRGWTWDGYHRDVGTVEAYQQAQEPARKMLARRGIGPDGAQNAVFLDRDGTIIEHVHYLADVADVRLIPGAAEAIIALRRNGFRCVVVSNQSAVGRELITHEQLQAINDEMCSQLADQGAVLDAIYCCTSVPASDDRTVIEDENRKPGPGMLLRAARELNLRMDRSWMIGDMISDVLAGANAGCRGSVLLGAADTTPSDGTWSSAADLRDAAQQILSSTSNAADTELADFKERAR